MLRPSPARYGHHYFCRYYYIPRLHIYIGDGGMACLTLTGSGRAIEVPIRDDLGDTLVELLHSALLKVGSERLGQVAAHRLLSMANDLAQPDQRPPSPAQIRFAVDIADKYNLALPIGALTDRSVLGWFLSQYTSGSGRKHAPRSKSDVEQSISGEASQLEGEGSPKKASSLAPTIGTSSPAKPSSPRHSRSKKNTC